MTEKKSPQIFLAYARKDTNRKNELLNHIDPLLSGRGTKIWHDREIIFGQDWDEKIKEALKSSDILIFLASSDSLASNACKNELAQFMSMEKKYGVIVLRACGWRHVREISSTQVAPLDRDGHVKPVVKWLHKDDAWQNAADHIEKMLDAYGDGGPPTSSQPPPSGQSPPAGTLAFVSIDKSRRAEANAHYARALLKKQEGDPKGALADYGRAIGLDPRASTYYARAGLRQQEGDSKGALEDYGRAIELEPRASTYYARAGLRKQEGNPKGALKDYGRAIELDSQDTAAHYARALLKKQEGDSEGARTDFEAALNLAREDGNRGLMESAQKALNNLDRENPS